MSVILDIQLFESLSPSQAQAVGQISFVNVRFSKAHNVSFFYFVSLVFLFLKIQSPMYENTTFKIVTR